MVHCRRAIIPDGLFSSNEVLSCLYTLIVTRCGFLTIFYFKEGLHTTWGKKKKEVEKPKEKELHFVFSFPAPNSSSVPWTISTPLMDIQIAKWKMNAIKEGMAAKLGHRNMAVVSTAGRQVW